MCQSAAFYCHSFALCILGVFLWRQNDFFNLDHLRLIQFKEHQLIIAVLHELPTEPITQVFIPLHDVKKSLCQATAAKCAGTPASFFQPTPADRMQS